LTRSSARSPHPPNIEAGDVAIYLLSISSLENSGWKILQLLTHSRWQSFQCRTQGLEHPAALAPPSESLHHLGDELPNGGQKPGIPDHPIQTVCKIVLPDLVEIGSKRRQPVRKRCRPVHDSSMRRQPSINPGMDLGRPSCHSWYSRGMGIPPDIRSSRSRRQE